MSERSALHFDTLAVHGGFQADPATGALAVPIYQTTSYLFQDTGHAARLFALEEAGNIYTRIMNPTVAVLEERVAALEGGVGALALASGQAAETLAILNIARAGDEIVASSNLYGGTFNLLASTLPRYGVTTRFVDPSDPGNFRAAIGPSTRAIYAETLGNPRLDVLDIEAVARIAHEAGIPLIVDNTFATPYLCRPFDWGADIVVHSLTKFLGGHGSSIGGIIVDGGRFDWENGKFPELSEPDPTYHGISYTRQFGAAAYVTKARTQLLRDLGPALSPFNAFLILQGVETLPLRMERHVQNAQTIAAWLSRRPEVSWVRYPGLPDDPYHALAEKYLPRGAGAILAFGLAGGREAGAAFIDALHLFRHVANVGDARSLIIHPATTTHQQLSEEEQLSSGVSPDLVRASIGIEDARDLIDDLDQALVAATGRTAGAA